MPSPATFSVPQLSHLGNMDAAAILWFLRGVREPNVPHSEPHTQRTYPYHHDCVRGGVAMDRKGVFLVSLFKHVA